ncbi:hypothetical protein [Streptomyces sp. NPDC052727]|uniref:hypothetical protein n=1 Tax=unclassified Streptomyces TaxID=2593676 RepID=UPI003426CFD0
MQPPLEHPRIRPHGACLFAEHGPTVAYAHGPQEYVMRYEDPTTGGAQSLGSNPWVYVSVTRPGCPTT